LAGRRGAFGRGGARFAGRGDWRAKNWGWGWGGNWWGPGWGWWGNNWWPFWLVLGSTWYPRWAYDIEYVPVTRYETYVRDYVTLPAQERTTQLTDLLTQLNEKLNKLIEGNNSQVEALNTLQTKVTAAEHTAQVGQLLNTQQRLSARVQQIADKVHALQSTATTATQSQVQELATLAQTINSVIDQQQAQSEKVAELSSKVLEAKEAAGELNLEQEAPEEYEAELE
jgi:hypothetical protein